MRSGTSRPSTRAQRQALAFVVVSLLAHGSLLAALSFVQLSRCGAPARSDHDDDPFLMQLTLRSTPFLVQSQPEPVAEPAPEPVAEIAPEPEPAREPEPVVEVEPELAPEPGPPPPEPPAAVVTSTAEEAPAVASSAQASLAPPVEVPSVAPAPAAPPVATPAAPAPAPVPVASPQAGSSLGDLDDGFHLRALRSDRPEYPDEARRRNEEGTVTCRLTIDRDGRVIEVEIVLSSGSKALDAAAARVLKRWRFEPLARLTDRKSAHAIQKLTFELKSARR